MQASGIPSGAIDVVGDIHGCFEALRSLVEKLGYSRGPTGWFHPEGRRIIFVGDYIDRGSEPVKSTALVRQLCDDGVAFALLGNHDVNAIQFSLRSDVRGMMDPSRAHREACAVLDKSAPPMTHWLRKHHGSGDVPKNIHQHINTLRNTTAEQYESIVRWTCRLPAWIELPGLRAVHAAWITPAMQKLDKWAAESGLPSLGIRAQSIDEAIEMQKARLMDARLSPSPELWHDLLNLGDCRAERSRPDCCIAVALERVLKGVEAELPKGVSYRDAEQFERHAVRVRWFEPAIGRTFAEHALVRREARLSIERDTRGERIGPQYAGILPMTIDEAYGPEERPVFFGHFGLSREDSTIGWPPNVACVDTSVFDIRQGALAAYRWKGESALAVGEMAFSID